MANPLPVYGGQALLEGVLMRGRHTLAIAVRAPAGDIQLQTEQLGALYQSRWMQVPFVRGVLGLWDSLSLGVRGLNYSARVANGEPGDLQRSSDWGSVVIGIGFALALFFLLPAGLSALVELWVPLGSWRANLLEGVLRLAILIGYMLLVGLLPEIARVFAYHGAEHKTINAFEAGAELVPERVAEFSLLHPRCGTAFLLLLVVFSVLLFSLIGQQPLLVRLATRIAFIPVLAGVAYELLRFVARNFGHPLVRALAAPGLAMQRLTTREPDAEMLAVAIAAFECMRAGEKTATAHTVGG